MQDRHPLYVADRLWLIAHHETTGEGRVNDQFIDLALAGALLAELALRRKISVSQLGELQVLDSRPTNEAVTQAMLERIDGQNLFPPEHRVTLVRDWLVHFSGYAHSWVASRLEERGKVARFQTREGLLRRRVTRHRVVDINDSIQPGIHISSRLRRNEPLRIDDVAFAAMALAAELRDHLLLDFGPGSDGVVHDAYLRRLIGGLPLSLRLLIAETQSAIGDAVLTHRA